MNLIIVGASGFGREIEQLVYDINQVNSQWNVLGFLDDNLNALDGVQSDYSIIGSIKDWQPNENDFFVLALAFPEVKKNVVKMLKDRGAKFATLVHPTATISKFAHIGEGVVITQRSGLNANAKVGDFATILESGIAHDAELGNYSTLSGRVNINGHVKVGDMVYIGCGVSVAPGKKIGDGAQIGIGSVVISNVKPGTTVFGNPAKKLEF